MSNVPGFYRALQTSVHPEYGPRFGGSWMSPTGVMTPIVPIVASGERSLTLAGVETQLPIVRDSAEERDAVRRLAAVLDGNSAPYPLDDGIFRGTAADNQAIEGHLASIFADPTYRSFFPQEYGIGIRGADGQLDATGDVATMYHAEQLLKTFLPTVMVVSLIDVDACHDDYNAYLYSQPIADACIRHLWDTIQSTEGLRDETALFVMPEHGRQLAFNGKNPDSLGRSGLDHGGGDDGDRDVWDAGPGAGLQARRLRSDRHRASRPHLGPLRDHRRGDDRGHPARVRRGHGLQPERPGHASRPGDGGHPGMKARHLSLACLPLLLALGACTEAIDAGGSPPVETDVDIRWRRAEVRSTASTTAPAHHRRELRRAARTLHSGQFEPNLHAALAYENLSGAPRWSAPSSCAWRPARKDSLFIHKLRNQDVITQMPLGAAPLSDADIQALEAWIDAGALRRPGAEPAPVLNNPPLEPQFGIFDPLGTRLDPAGPVSVAAGDTLVFRMSVEDFETPDADMPYVAIVLQTVEGLTAGIGAAANPTNGLATYSPDDAPEGKGDTLDFRFEWTVPEMVRLTTTPESEVPRQG